MNKKFFRRILWLITGTLFPAFLFAQNPTYTLDLRNDLQVSSTVYEFDIYLLRTGTTTFEYASGQYGILINPLIKNGGTISASIVAGSSDPALVATNQNPTSIGFNNTSNAIMIAAKSPPTAGNGAIISNISPGVRLCRVRISNTVDFGQYQPNLTWTTTSIYPTQVYAYVGGINTAITIHSNHTTIYLNNPVLNPPIPDPPVATAGSGIGCTGFTANWNSSTGATSYELDVSTNSSFSTFVPGYNDLNVGNVTSYGVTGLTAGTVYYYRVRAGNSYGTSENSNTITCSTSPAAPATPGPISGTTPQCEKMENQVYSVASVPNAISYTWKVPEGWEITAGQGSTSITVSTGVVGDDGEISVYASNTCGNSSVRTLAVTVIGAPGLPGAITGTSAQCPGLTGQVYSIAAVSGATSYTWTVPTGWSITGGQGTTSITVTAGAYGNNGNISVYASNTCGNSAPNTLAVTVLPGTPATPGTITGTTAQCLGLTGQIYSIAAVTNASTYTWTVPSGWSITAGQGTTSITVTTGAYGNNGNITVTAGNSCGTSSARLLGVTILPGTPATPGAISGTTAQCPALSGRVYSISPVSGASTYTWTVPAGWSISNGQGTNSITVTTGSTGNNGSITVNAGNSCGTSAINSLAVTVLPAAPATPGAISGTTAQCPARTGQIYSISSVTNATTYTWTVPSGWSVTAGQGTTSVTVTTGAAGQNGNITVTAGNSCGTSSASSLPVTVSPGTPASPGTITGTAAQCPGLTGQVYSISAVTNATTYTWTIPTGWTITAGAGTTSITVTTGAPGNNGSISVTAGNSCGTSGSSSIAVTVSPAAPSTPGAINGTAAQCPALSGQIYSIGSVTNATTYTWTVPTGWTISAGQGTTSIAVVTGLAGNNGNITVTAGNTCGTSTASTLPVTVAPGTPASPSALPGSGAGCSQITANWSASANATSYRLDVSTVSNFATFVTGFENLNTGNVTTYPVTGLTAGTPYYYRVRAVNSCGTSGNSFTTTYSTSPATPAIPGTISGTIAQCPGLSGQIYSITAVPNATTYTWTVPSGWSISAGQGTVSLTVTTGSAGQNGNITVTAGNSCGTSAPNSLAVTVSPGTPPAPGTISGTAAQCPALTGQTYTIAVVSNATTYNWTVPTGWSITGGQGTTSLTVTTGSAGQNGNISVTAGNSCGTSSPSTLAVTVLPGTPAIPGAISGTTAQCPGLTGQGYSISSVANATTYTWAVPTGWTITAGQGTRSISVSTGTAGQNGNITVTAGNSCGTSSPNTLAVTVQPGTPATPGTITGNDAQCPSLTGQIYSISPITNATTYTWTVPTGWSITAGQGTTSLTVTTGTAGLNGNITVTAGNSCGTSAASSLPVTVLPGTPSTPGTITGTTSVCPGITGLTYSISNVTNATTYTWSVPAGWTIMAGQGTTSLTVTSGDYGQNGNISVTAGNSCGTSTARTRAVTVLPGTPTQPASITGVTAQCPALVGQNYSISAITNATTYAWTVPNGWTITAGQGTTEITVTTGLYNQNGSIAVTAGNSCGTSSPGTLAVTVSPAAPATPGAITGTVAQCPALGGQIYSIAAVANATAYTWSVPAGWLITAGQNSTSITVTTGSAGQNGSISVTAGNSCGTSTASALAVTVGSQSAAPTGISITNNNTCSGTSKTLNVTGGSLGTGASWEWFTVSCGGTFAGTGSNIIVDPAAGTSTTYYVRATGICNTTACASGTVVVLPSVGIPSTPVPSASSVCQGSPNTSYTTLASNATSYTWSVTGSGNTISGTGTTGTVTWSPSYTGVATITVVANGCNGPSASASTTVTVNPVPVPTLTSSETDNAFCSGASVTFTAGGGTGYNFRVNGTSRQTGASNIFSTSTLTNGQVVDVIVTNDLGCSATSAGIANTVYTLPVPTLSSSDPDNIFCMGTTVTFLAAGGINYDFRIGGVTVQNGASNTFITSTLTNGQTVSVFVTNSNGCTATSAGITNYVNTLPFIAVTTPAACAPNLLTYSLGVTVNTGTVTSTAGTVTSAGTNVWNITGVPSGTNITVTVRDIAGCESSIAITAPNCNCPVIIPPVTGGDRSYCFGNTIPTISASVAAGETVDWYDMASGGVLLRSASLTYTPSEAGTYYAMARNTTTNCVSTTRTPVTVTVYSLPVPTISSSDADNIFCAGTSVVFTAGGGTTFNFRVNGTSVQNGTSSTYTTTSLTNGQVVDVIVTNSNGCPATSASITNTVQALPSPTLTSSDPDNTFCSGTSVTFNAGGGTSYNFRVNGSSVQNGSSSTYTTTSLTNGQIVDVIVTNDNGCSATSSQITNTVRALPNPTLTSSDADNVFCEGSAITFTAGGGSSYNFRVNGTSVQNGTSTTYITSAVTDGQVVDVIVTNSNGCMSTSTQIINSVDARPEADAGTGGNECDLTFQLNAIPSVGIGTWTRTAGPSGATATFSPSSNSPTAIATVSAYGTYTFTWTETNGTCSASSSVTVNFYRQPVASAGTGGNNCGLSYILNGSLDIGTGTWTRTAGPGTATFTPNANTPGATVTVSQYGSYTFRWTVTNGTCTTAPTVNVNFYSQPPADAGEGGIECDLDFQLNAVPASGTSSGSWSRVSGPGNVAFSPNPGLYNAKVTVDQFGTYVFAWTTVNVTCQSTDIITVEFHDLPQVNAGRDTIICEDGSAQLQAVGTGTFAWMPAEELSDPAIANPHATPEVTTTFTVTLTDQYGCKNSDAVEVEVWNIPLIDAGPDRVLEYLFTADLAATQLQIHETGTWSVAEGEGQFSASTNPVTKVNGLAQGENIVLWRVTNGVCQPVDDYVTLKVNDLFIPSLITPNGDPYNQYFELQGIQTLGTTELVIFDRRGAQVYKNKNYDNTWEGKDYNGNDLPDDTYFYVIKSQNGKSLSGFVVIRR